MSVILIPTSELPYYSQKTRLEGRDYILKFAYNQRQDRWSLSLYDEQEDPIVLGIKLVTNWRLLVRYQFDPRTPPGELRVVDQTGNDTPPGFYELGEGKRCQLNYFESS